MNVVVANAPSGVGIKASKIHLEQRLKDAINEKHIAETTVKKQQNELDQLISSATSMSKQQNSKKIQINIGTVEGIDKEIAQLELERTINSMSLAAEREILKKIHKLNIARRQLCEKEQHDQQIKEQKAAVSTLRGSLKEKRADISELKTELSTVQTAVALGCEVKDLLGKKIGCPTEKIGTILGKKGKNIQEIMSNNNVDVQIVKDQGDIHLIGTSLESLDAVVAKLEEAMTKVDKTVEMPSSLHYYLTSSNIMLMPSLRTRHPDIIIDMKRIQVEENTNSTNNQTRSVRIRGNPADIAAFEADVMDIECISADVTVSSRISGFLVGKSGKNIDEIVKTYQVVVDIERPTKAEALSKDGAPAESHDESTKVKICGPPSNVETVLTMIHNVIEENRDREELIQLEAIVKVVLLHNNGSGIQALQKNINVESKKNMEAGASNSILINVKGNDLAVKGKTRAVQYVLPMVKTEVARVTSMINRIKIDPLAIPVLIGKGGQGIKALLKGSASVHLEIHSKVSEVEICGLDEDEVENVTRATKAVIDTNQVQRLRLQCDDTGTTNSFMVQFRDLTRSAAMKQIKQLVVLSADFDSKELALRGTPENLMQASKLIQDFLDTNFMEELVVSAEDVRALLTGGKSSKIAEIASDCGVNLTIDKERNVAIAKGEKLKVVNAVKAVREFLYGSANVAVLNIELSDKDAMGVLIGKSGKTMAEVRAKFSSVSVIVHRTDAAITLRGDSHQVHQCHSEMMARLLTASITRNVELTKEQMTDVTTIKFLKRLGSLASVRVEVDNEKNIVSLRGARADVYGALTMLKEHLTGMYECQWFIGHSFFKKLFDICSKSNHLLRINQESGAKIHLDEGFEEIVLSGTKENVKAAKKEVSTFLDFVFGETMKKFDVPVAAFPMMGKSTFLNEVITASSVTVVPDKDMTTILMFSTSDEKLNEATSILETKLNAVEKLIFIWQFSESDEWLLSLIIGKKGENVQKLRRDTNCTIEVNSEERRMVVSADDVTVVSKGKSVIDDYVDKARNENAVIEFSAVDLPAFIGKSGKNMKAFMEKYNIKIEVTKKGDAGVVRLTGPPEQVSAAQLGVMAWKENRLELRNDAEGNLTKPIQLRNIPVIIGTKGETIRSLQREFGCKVVIDRVGLTYTVTGGTSTKREALCERFDSLISENDAAKRKDTEILDPAPAVVVEHVGEVMEFADEPVVNFVEQMD